MGFCCSTQVQENVDPGIIIGKKSTPGVDMFKEVEFPDELPIDQWTKQDWELLLEIQGEDSNLWEALPETVKQNGAEFLGEMMTPDGKDSKEKEDDNDFFVSDKNKDGRLTFEEFKILQNRIYDEDVKRFGEYIQYNEDQLNQRYKFYCALAKSIYGPSRNTMRKHKKMVTEYYMPLMTLKNQINNPDGSKVNIEKTWSVDEMDEYLAIVKDSMDKLNALPEDTRQSILAFMEEMKQNQRVQLDQDIFNLQSFKEADKDGDGRLNYSEYIVFQNKSNEHFQKQFGQFIVKSDQDHQRDYQLLCKLAYSQKGPTISTLAKSTNMLQIALTKQDLDAKKIEVMDDPCQVDSWTNEQYLKFIEIDDQNENHLMQNLPPNMYESKQKYMNQFLIENYTREMQLLSDQLLFTLVDLNKDGYLNIAEFRNYIKEREQAMEKELGGKYVNITQDQVQNIFNFLCDIGGSNKGPTVLALRKWMNMWLSHKKSHQMGGKPTLSYFDQVWARGEPIRMALWKAGIEYNDNLISNNQWIIYKSDKVKCPRGQLPTFELTDGTVLTGTTVILGYIGDICQLHPTDSFAKASAMSLYLSTFGDLMEKFPAVLFTTDDDQTEKFQELLDNDIIPWFKTVEAALPAENKFLAGNQLTVYDFAIGGLFTNLICNPNARNAEQLSAAWENSAPDRVKNYYADFCAEMKPYLDKRTNHNQYDL